MESVYELEDVEYVETIDFSGLLDGGDVVIIPGTRDNNAASDIEGGELGHEVEVEEKVLTESMFSGMLYDFGLTCTQTALLIDLLRLCSDISICGKRPDLQPLAALNAAVDVYDDVWSTINTLLDNGGTLEYKGTPYLGMITPSSIKKMYLSQRMTCHIGYMNDKEEVEEITGMGWDQMSAFYRANTNVEAHLGILLFVVGSVGVGTGYGRMWASITMNQFGTYSVVDNYAIPVNLLTEVGNIPTDDIAPEFSHPRSDMEISVDSMNSLESYTEGSAPDIIAVINGLEYVVEHEVTVRLMRCPTGYYDREMCKKYPVVEKSIMANGTVECVVRGGVLHALKNVEAKPNKVVVVESAHRRPNSEKVMRDILRKVKGGPKMLPCYPTSESAAKYFSQSREILDMRQVYYVSSIYGHRFNQEQTVAVRKYLQQYKDWATQKVVPQEYDYVEFFSFDNVTIDRKAKYSLEGMASLLIKQGFCVDMRVLRHRIQMEMSVYGDACYFNDKANWILPKGLEEVVDDLFLRNGGVMRYNDVVMSFRHIKHDHIDGEPRDLVRYLLRSGKYIYTSGRFKLFPRGVSIWVRYKHRFFDTHCQFEKLKEKFKDYMRFSPFSKKMLDIGYNRLYPNSTNILIGVKTY